MKDKLDQLEKQAFNRTIMSVINAMQALAFAFAAAGLLFILLALALAEMFYADTYTLVIVGATMAGCSFVVSVVNLHLKPGYNCDSSAKKP